MVLATRADLRLRLLTTNFETEFTHFHGYSH